MKQSLPWFRYYIDLLDDRSLIYAAKTANIDKATFIGAWTILLLLAARSPKRGSVYINEKRPFTQVELAEEFHLPLDLTRTILEALEESGLLAVDERGAYFILKWLELQYESDNSTTRVQAWRKKKKRGQQDRTAVTFHETSSRSTCNVIDTDTDTDAEIETESETEKETEKEADVDADVVTETKNEIDDVVDVVAVTEKQVNANDNNDNNDFSFAFKQLSTAFTEATSMPVETGGRRLSCTALLEMARAGVQPEDIHQAVKELREKDYRIANIRSVVNPAIQAMSSRLNQPPTELSWAEEHGYC